MVIIVNIINIARRVPEAQGGGGTIGQRPTLGMQTWWRLREPTAIEVGDGVTA